VLGAHEECDRGVALSRDCITQIDKRKRIIDRNGKGHAALATWPLFNAGNYLLSHTLSRAVPSAQRGLTSVFGMGTGGTPAVRSPTTCSRQPSTVSHQQTCAVATLTADARQTFKELEDEVSQLNRLGETGQAPSLLQDDFVGASRQYLWSVASSF
jgi:hypothetical protein